MDLSKSIDFLLDNAGPVIQYRLRKEILKNLDYKSKTSLMCDLTYWAVELLHLYGAAGF